MAGFLYVRKAPGTPASSVRRQHEAALATFAAERVTQGATLDGGDFTLFLFQKRYARGKQLVQFGNGDFAAAVGTLFYQGKTGEPALRELYADYGCADLYAGLAGQFGVILRKRGKVAWFNDYFGVYHLFESEQVVSTSLLAAAATLPQLRLSRQALHEYLFDGAVYGAETLFEGVRRLGTSRGPRHAPIPESFDEQVDAAAADLVAYCDMLRANFGEEMPLGFSEGSGSRLLLAAALKARMRPRLLVDGAADTADVRLARAIAEGERLPLEHLDTEGRMARIPMQLNGAGGEIYGDFWKLPDRPIRTRDFVRRALGFKIPVAHREALVRKIGKDKLTREEVALLYTTLRTSAFAGPACKEMSLLGWSFLPFAEPRLVFASARLPLAHKVRGRFEAEMIRRLSPRLAAYRGARWIERVLRKKSPHDSVIDFDRLALADYIDPQAMRAIEDPHFASRVRSAELLLTTSWQNAAALPRAA